MKCVICKKGETRDGTATVTLERGSATIVIKSVPAQVCEICGEEYISESVTARLMEQAEQAAGKGVSVDIRQYVAA